MNTQELIDEAVLLPVEKRFLVVDALLRSLNRPESELDTKWAKEAKRRLAEFQSGGVKAIPGEDVFRKVLRKFDK